MATDDLIGINSNDTLPVAASLLQNGIIIIHSLPMRIRWDETKRQQVLQRRHIDFAQLDELLALPYVEDQRRDDPEQYRLIGFIGGRLVTFIVEYREDTLGELLWVVTAWHATRQEQRAYEQAIR